MLGGLQSRQRSRVGGILRPSCFVVDDDAYDIDCTEDHLGHDSLLVVTDKLSPASSTLYMFAVAHSGDSHNLRTCSRGP